MPTTRTTPQHTPTPYRIVRHNEQQEYPHCAPYVWEVWTQDEDAEQPVALVTDEADANLIVRAVNSHAALVEALEKLIAWEDRRRERALSVGAQIARSADYDSARAALAAAKGTK